VRTLAGYLDALDTVLPTVPAAARILAALGPRMLGLARDRAAGASGGRPSAGSAH
jgi:hypothetical protein